MIRRILNKLPNSVRRQVEIYRECYTRYDGNFDRFALGERDKTRVRMAGYVLGLRDAGLITERERQYIFVYMTVKCKKEVA